MELPKIGLGTCFGSPDEMRRATGWALENSYRLIDCAPRYENQRAIGEAIQAAIQAQTVKRDEVFVISKLYHTCHRPELVVSALKETLKELGLEYLDCWMMHAPWSFVPLKDDEISCTPREDKFGAMVEDVDFLATWVEMEKCVQLGLCKHIAVSNFSSAQLERLLQNSTIKPIINQVECHAYFNNERLNQFCKSKSIKLMAFHPIGETRVKTDESALRDDPRLAELASKYKKTPAQILLRFAIERGIIPIPKSGQLERLKENYNVFDFELDDSTREALFAMEIPKRFYLHGWIKKLSKFYPFSDEF